MLNSPNDPIKRGDFEETGFCYTLSLISGKYKMIILYCLKEYEAVRFNELKRYLKASQNHVISDQKLDSVTVKNGSQLILMPEQEDIDGEKRGLMRITRLFLNCIRILFRVEAITNGKTINFLICNSMKYKTKFVFHLEKVWER